MGRPVTVAVVAPVRTLPRSQRLRIDSLSRIDRLSSNTKGPEKLFEYASIPATTMTAIAAAVLPSEGASDRLSAGRDAGVRAGARAPFDDINLTADAKRGMNQPDASNSVPSD